MNKLHKYLCENDYEYYLETAVYLGHASLARLFRLINAHRSFTVFMKKIREKNPVWEKNPNRSSSNAIMSTFRNTSENVYG
jgi:hypothetical protein